LASDFLSSDLQLLQTFFVILAADVSPSHDASKRFWLIKLRTLLNPFAMVGIRFSALQGSIGADVELYVAYLVGMGVLPCQFQGDTSAQTLGLDGTEEYELLGIEVAPTPRQRVTLVVHRRDGREDEVPLTLRIDTPIEVDYYKHGGILPFVLRQLLAA
jgi:hypothetical protein